MEKLLIREDCCCYCGRRLVKIKGHIYELTIDHVIPKSNGGSNHPFNKLPCCKMCNALKADNSLEYFLEQVSTNCNLKIWSKNELKRWQHMERHISKIIYCMPDFKLYLTHTRFLVNYKIKCN